MTDHAQLLLLMGLAGGVLLFHSAMLIIGRRRLALISGVVWYVGCLVPVIHAQGGRGPIASAIDGSQDFAGAAALHVSLAAFAWGLSRVAPDRRTTHQSMWPHITNLGALRVIIVLLLVWTGWLIAIEGRLSLYTMTIVVTCLVLGSAGSLAAAAAALLRGRPAAAAAVRGGLIGLAVASAASASISLLAAGMVGVVAGATSALVFERGREAQFSMHGLIACAGVGGAIGLVTVGLLDERAGFFFTGQPTLLLAQTVVLLVTSAWAVALGIALSLIGRVATTGRRSRE